jgi:hypothetical protein
MFEPVRRPIYQAITSFEELRAARDAHKAIECRLRTPLMGASGDWNRSGHSGDRLSRIPVCDELLRSDFRALEYRVVVE